MTEAHIKTVDGDLLVVNNVQAIRIYDDRASYRIVKSDEFKSFTFNDSDSKSVNFIGDTTLLLPTQFIKYIHLVEK